MTAKNKTKNIDNSNETSAESTVSFDLSDTRIEVAGVMRCCLGTVAEEYREKDGVKSQKVRIGMKSKCRHCNISFTLIEAKPHPKWKPDWQLQEASGSSAFAV